MSYIPPDADLEPEDLADRLQELEFLQHLDNELHYILDLNHVLDITLDWAMRRTGADTGLIAKSTDEGLRVMRVTGYAYQYATKLMREPLPLDEGVLGRAVLTGKPIYMAYVGQDQTLIYEKTHSHFTVPLIVKNEILGVLHLESRHPAHFNVRMRDFLQHIANRAAVALRNAELYTRAYNAEQVKSDMIRMAAHDLRNPLNTIINASHLLKRLRTQIPDPAFKFVQSIERAAHQMRSLLEELLTLERLESGVKIESEPVDCIKVLEEALSRSQPDAVSKSQEFTVHAPQSPLITRGEFVYFRQAMVNLVNNAIKYTPHRGKIIVRIHRDGERIHFQVTDNGYGISEERQKRLFQRFYRAHEPGTEHIEGTGLGLSLVKAIIERSGGEVWFQSVPNEGSTFGFWLPALDIELSESMTQAMQRVAEESMYKIPREADIPPLKQNEEQQTS